MAKKNSNLEFIKAALRHPLQISTLFQTSPWLAEKMLSYVDFEKAEHVIELGSGAGAITEPLIKKMRPSTRLTAFELNEELVAFLKESFSSPMIDFRSASAADAHLAVEKYGPAQAVISSLPWTVFPESLQAAILDSIKKSLAPGGVFLTYTCVNASFYPSSKVFQRLIQARFRTCEKSNVEWRNIPPAFINICRN